jgi:hypothetical protein
MIDQTIASLTQSGIDVFLVNTAKDAVQKVLELIPERAEVMTNSSVTIDSIGLSEILNASGKYNSVKKSLSQMDRKTEGLKMQKLGAAPEYTVGSVHAVTEDGKIVIASNTGSQLPGYAYASAHVIWVAGIQKIVPDLDAAFKRIYDYVLPLESARVKKAYGMEKSNVSKLLVINKEVVPHRLTLILVNETIGF